MQNQKIREPTRSVVIVAPVWLQNVLSLWLQTYGKVTSVICAATLEALPFDPLAAGKALVPDLVILSAPDESATKQVQQSKQMWPTTHLLLFADAGQAELLTAGADALLPKEFSSQELLEAIKLLPPARQSLS